MNKSTIKTLALAALASAGSFLSAHAQSIGYTSVTSTQTDGGGNYGEAGIEFTLNQNITLTALGINAIQIQGADSPQVSIYDVTGGIVAPTGTAGAIATNAIDSTGPLTAASLTSNPGAGAANTAVFTYLTPTTPNLSLLSGHTYLITGPGYWIPLNTTGNYTVDPGATGVFSSFQFMSVNGSTTGAGFVGGGTSHGFYDTYYTTGNNGGGNNLFTNLAPVTGTVPVSVNFQFSVTAAPEPSTYALTGFGLLALAVGLRKRR